MQTLDMKATAHLLQCYIYHDKNRKNVNLSPFLFHKHNIRYFVDIWTTKPQSTIRVRKVGMITQALLRQQ